MTYYRFKRKEAEQEVTDWMRERAGRVQARQLARIARHDSGSILGNADVAPLYDETTEAGRELMERARATVQRKGMVLRVATGMRDVRDWKQRGDVMTWVAMILALFTLGFYTGLGIWLKVSPPSTREVQRAEAARAVFVAPLIAAHRGESTSCE